MAPFSADWRSAVRAHAAPCDVFREEFKVTFFDAFADGAATDARPSCSSASLRMQ